MKQVVFTIFLVILFLGACDKDDDKIVIPDGPVKYTVSFNLNWNSADFPTDYPTGAHFSELIGWSHKPTSYFFAIGSLASPGIKAMAETGATTPLDNEIDSKILNGEGLTRVIGGNLGTGVGTIEVEIEIDKNNPCVTLTTMVAPSPDWYIACVNINLLNESGFMTEKTVNLKVYDAGTDDGTSYTSPNSVTEPQQAISLFVDPPMGDGTSLNAVVGTVKFVKVN